MKKKNLENSAFSGIVRGLFGKYPQFKLPSNYRTITIVIISLFLFFLIFLISLDFYKNLLKKQEIEATRTKLTSEIQFWQKVIEKYKDYRDAYFQLAVLEYKLGNFERARDFLQKTSTLDPNFKPALELDKVLDKR